MHYRKKKNASENVFLNMKVSYKYEYKEFTDNISMPLKLLKKPCNKIKQTNH